MVLEPLNLIYVFSCAEREAPPARRPLLMGGRFFLYRLGILEDLLWFPCAGGDDP